MTTEAGSWIRGGGYFSEFLPRADAGVTCDQLRASASGWDTGLAAREADAAAVGAALRVLRAECARQEHLVRHLADGWAGDAADAARERIGAHVGRAREECERVAAVHGAMTDAVRVARTALDAASEVAAGFDVPLVAGHTPAEVDLMTTRTAAGESWLREVLVPHVQSQAAAFLALCDATTLAVDGARQLLAEALDLIDADIGAEPATVPAPVSGPADPPGAGEGPAGRVPDTQVAEPVSAGPEPEPREQASEPESGQGHAEPEPESEPEPVRAGLDPEPPQPDTDFAARPSAAETAPAAADSGADLAEAGPL